MQSFPIEALKPKPKSISEMDANPREILHLCAAELRALFHDHAPRQILKRCFGDPAGQDISLWIAKVVGYLIAKIALKLICNLDSQVARNLNIPSVIFEEYPPTHGLVGVEIVPFAYFVIQKITRNRCRPARISVINRKTNQHSHSRRSAEIYRVRDKSVFESSLGQNDEHFPARDGHSCQSPDSVGGNHFLSLLHIGNSQENRRGYWHQATLTQAETAEPKTRDGLWCSEYSVLNIYRKQRRRLRVVRIVMGRRGRNVPLMW